MYYFELFELPVSLIVNKAAVLKKYYQLSLQYHPDRYTLQDVSAQAGALAMSATINEAKVVLDDAYLRLNYILKEKQVIEPEEKYALSPAFLAEMMDINEQLMELAMDEDANKKEKIKSEIEALSTGLLQEVKPYFDAEIFDADHADFVKLKDYYYKQKYLNRLLEKV